MIPACCRTQRRLNCSTGGRLNAAERRHGRVSHRSRGALIRIDFSKHRVWERHGDRGGRAAVALQGEASGRLSGPCRTDRLVQGHPHPCHVSLESRTSLNVDANGVNIDESSPAEVTNHPSPFAPSSRTSDPPFRLQGAGKGDAGRQRGRVLRIGAHHACARRWRGGGRCGSRRRHFCGHYCGHRHGHHRGHHSRHEGFGR